MKPEEAIKILSEYPDMIIIPSDRQFDYKEACRMAIEALNRPHGEWLPKYDDNGGRRYVCSICGEPCYTLLWTEPEPRDRFCLWCGADMRTQNDRSWDTSERGVSGSVKNSIAQEEGEAE